MLTSCYPEISLSLHLSRLTVFLNFSYEFYFFPLLFLFYLGLTTGSMVFVLFFLVEMLGYLLNTFICGVKASYEVAVNIMKEITLLRLFFVRIMLEYNRLGSCCLGKQIGLFRCIFFTIQRNVIIEKVVNLDSFHPRALLLNKLYIKK